MLVCEINSNGTSLSFMVTDCLANLFSGINVANSVPEEITSEEQSRLMRRQIVWKIYSDLMT